MTDGTPSAARLERFYRELSPSLETVKQALTFAGVDAAHPKASDLYTRNIDCHNLGMYPMLQRVADAVTEYEVPGPDDTILDVGCGLGGPGRFLADRFGCSVLGIDLLPLRVDLARELAQMTGTTSRVSYRVGDATALGVTDASFAQVWMLDVSMHIRDKRALFTEIARVLQPNGLLVMHEQTGPLPPAMRPLRRQAPYIAPTLPQLVRHVEAAGLRLLTWRDTTPIVLDYFLEMRDLVLETPEPGDSRRRTGIPLLDAYLETLAGGDGRTGMLLAQRV